MSGNWDDSDSGSEEVEIVEKPVIIPRSRTVSVAKSLEKVAILESSVHGSQKSDDESDDETSSIGTIEGSESLDDSGDVLTLDFDSTTNTHKIISQFPCAYQNIIAEFADVEIFLISLDSLVVELTAHKYHNWQLGGQSIVLNTQIERFLQQFVNLGGRFKLVVFTDFASLFARDTIVAFARATALAYLSSSSYAKDLVYFTSPADPNWNRFLAELTPSFLMISTDNFTKDVCAQEELNIIPQLETIVIHALSSAIPVVLLSSITVNFATVNAYYISPKLCIKQNWDSFLAAYWDCNSEPLKQAKNPNLDAKQFKSTADFWVHIIKEAKAGATSEHFEALACAVLLSNLVTTRRGPSRLYLAEKENVKRGLDVIRDRRNLLNTAVSVLEKSNFLGIGFSLLDFWDGRMILSLFDHIVANEAVLPYRLQEDFVKFHQAAGLSRPLAVDTSERLFDPLPEIADPLSNLPLLYKTTSIVIDQFAPESKKAKSENIFNDTAKLDYAQFFVQEMGWKLRQIEEDFAKKNEVKLEDAYQAKRYNKSRQFLSRWYENFANSLEGRGSNLLVDFSRAPKGYATKEEDEEDLKKKQKGGWDGQKPQKPGKPGAGGGKKGKELAKSKKDLILEANKKAKDQKIIESETKKITFATQQGKAACAYLRNLYPTLELPETKALCIYEITLREAREFLSNLTGMENMQRRRVECVDLVGRIKDCYVKHWSYLTDKQKEQIVDLWIMLGFEPPAGYKGSAEAKSKKLDLGMNMLYYQLEYGGQLIDIQSDPQKDDRVTGFAPDGWQRQMLDSVDRGNSAIIVAPTSAGKTFVSYYCIEKILRASDIDIVVYVSPSKALMNQACGSIYARFKNKLMARGKSLFGTLTPEFSQDALTCQVLVTVPESLEVLLLSTNPVVQEFVSHIKYVIFDEVHSIGASENAHIWEHLLLLINCPFLALSATIGNGEKLHSWLSAAESFKSDKKRRVDMIIYQERYSELELSIVNIESQIGETEAAKKVEGKLLQSLMPFGVYMPEKLRMFGIPDDQQLTARQILTLYSTLASVDDKTKNDFEPCKYFQYKTSEFVWLSRGMLRDLESKLKERFMEWLKTDEKKMDQVLKILGGGSVKEQLDYRAVPFNKEKVAKNTIVPLLDELRDENMLPAICFNDERHVCESLAIELVEELERREQAFLQSAEYKNKYEIKDEERIMKAVKKKRDAAEKKKKIGDKPDDELPEEIEDSDPLAAQRARLKQALEKFKFRGRGNGDPDLYDKMIERVERQPKMREQTRLLLRLFARGIGFHHPGLNMVEKGAVEVLFRAGHLAILFSTSTLALGVNMPCKTVIFGVDNPLFTPLLYRQMSGRAGRRGFDHSGNVIFMSIPTSKIRRLLTASLSNLQGNPPFTTSFLLRLMRFVHQKDVVSQETHKAISTLPQRAQVALSLLRHSFSLFTRNETVSGILSNQLKMYFAYSIQLLRHLQLLDNNCSGKNLAELVAYMQENEPGNLAFVHLLHQGCFHKILKRYVEDKQAAKLQMLSILANLFTRCRLPPSFDPENINQSDSDASKKYQIFLTGLPDNFTSKLGEFNEFATELYYKYMTAASPNKLLMAASFMVGGIDYTSDRALFQRDDLVSPVFDGFSHDSKFLPTINFDHHDHRGRKIYYNAYAYDFYIHESRKLLNSVNQLSVNRMWYLINDFKEALKMLSEGMDTVAKPHDIVCEVLRELYMDYDKKFRSAFGMNKKND